jgi:alpha-glucosidase
LNVAEQHFLKAADQRGFCIFPQRAEGEFEYECFEDDGESEAYRHDHYGAWQLQILTSSSGLTVKIEREGERYPQTGQILLLFPRQETRRIDLVGASVVKDACAAMNRELLVALA